MLDHPLYPGESSAIEEGPWHYGADYISVYFRGEPSKLQGLVPEPFKVTDGRGMAYVCEIVSVGDTNPDMVFTHPDRTSYREAALGVGCTLGKDSGIFYPVMWVTSEWSLLRGLLNGYQKRLADSIALTRLHPMNPALKPLGPGAIQSGFCVKGGERTLSVQVATAERGEPTDLPTFGSTFGLRNFPRTNPSQSQVSEAVEILKSNSKVSGVLLGEGTLDTTLEVGTLSPTLGATYSAGFTISGSRALQKA